MQVLQLRGTIIEYQLVHYPLGYVAVTVLRRLYIALAGKYPATA
jgi:hypothetical protein